MWPPTTTPCECSQPGWCERHKCQKTPEWHYACRRLLEEFERWEAAEGPCVGALPDAQHSQPARERCRYRSETVVAEIECELCGNRTAMLPIFACELLGNCTERRVGNKSSRARELPSCLSCEQYAP